jgi:hypothetical protein
MSHTCPECGQYCTCDMENHKQDAPADCMHACDTELEDAYDDCEPGLPASLAHMERAERIAAEVLTHPNCKADHLFRTADFLETVAANNHDHISNACRRSAHQLRSASADFPSSIPTEF